MIVIDIIYEKIDIRFIKKSFYHLFSSNKQKIFPFVHDICIIDVKINDLTHQDIDPTKNINQINRQKYVAFINYLSFRIREIAANE